MSSAAEQIRLTPSPGPDPASSSTPGVGLFPTAAVHHYDLSAGGRAALATDLKTAAGDCLRVAIFPRLSVDDDDTPDYSARDVGVVVRVGDREHRLTDQHGRDFAPGTKVLFCDQWNLICLDLGDLAGQRLDAVELDAGPQASGHGWVQWLGASALPVEPDDVVERVRTARGSHNGTPAGMSRGNTFPITCVPHGMHFLTPVTDARTRQWLYSWHGDVRAPDARPTLQGLAICHQPSPWISDRLGFQLMPWTGSAHVEPDLRERHFTHDTERDLPHRYAVDLEGGITAEMTPTSRAAAFRFRFDPDADQRPGTRGRGVVIDLPGDGKVDVEQLPDGRLAFHGFVEPPVGWRDEQRGPAGYVWGETKQPAHGRRAWGRTRIPDLPWEPYRQVRKRIPLEVYPKLPREQAVIVTLADDQAAELEIVCSMSFISTAQARRNLELEIGDASFDEIADRAHEAWQHVLGRLEIIGGSREARTQAWSNLHRLYCWPNVAHENLGTADDPAWAYASPFQPLQHKHLPHRTGCALVSGQLMVNNGYWDTYRTCWPMYHLLTPAASTGLVNGILQQYVDSGWMSRWSAPGHVDCMVGTSSDVIFADAAVHGVDFDELTAYESALRNATTPSPSPYTGRKGIDRGRFAGYIDTDTDEGFSWSMENANCDASIGLWSARLAERADDLGVGGRRDEFLANAVWFTHRAKAWRALFDERLVRAGVGGFGQGRRPDGSWRLTADDFDPRQWGHDWTETNAWGMAFHAPFDGAGLSDFLGGEDALERQLAAARTTPESASTSVKGSYGHVIHEMTEARNLDLGMIGMSNQPAHHIPFMHLFAGQHEQTQALVREITERLFVGSEIGQGYPGDEDNGEMSAWWLFAAIGLYPLHVGSGELAITTPLFEELSLARDNGKQLRVRCSDPSLTTIESVRVNGEPWHSVVLPVSLLTDDLDIEVTTTADATSRWARDSRPQSLPGGAWYPDRTSDAVVTRVSLDGQTSPTELTSDRLVTESLTAGETIEVVWEHPVDVSFVTITGEDAGLVEIEIRADDTDDVIATLDHRPWWPDQTMAHLVSATKVRRLRLTPTRNVALRQVEVY